MSGNHVSQVQLESFLPAHWPTLPHQAPAIGGHYLLMRSRHQPPHPAGVRLQVVQSQLSSNAVSHRAEWDERRVRVKLNFFASGSALTPLQNSALVSLCGH